MAERDSWTPPREFKQNDDVRQGSMPPAQRNIWMTAGQTHMKSPPGNRWTLTNQSTWSLGLGNEYEHSEYSGGNCRLINTVVIVCCHTRCSYMTYKSHSHRVLCHRIHPLRCGQSSLLIYAIWQFLTLPHRVSLNTDASTPCKDVEVMMCGSNTLLTGLFS